MKKSILSSIIALAILTTAAVAAPPDLVGEWTGSGRAIYPDGTVITMAITANIDNQEGDLVSGNFIFTLGEVSFGADFTGHIDKAKNLKGVMSTDGFGFGLAEAKWSGNKMEGVARDLSDLSTTYFEVYKAR